MKLLRNEHGQTMTEYILIILMVIIIGSSVFKKLDEYLISNPNSFLGRYLTSYSNLFTGSNDRFQGQYKFFNIRR